MIGRIKGILLAKKAQEVLVDVQGVGYEIHVPMTSVFELPAVGGEVVLLTHLVVREDAHLLYGFLSEKERGVFRVLIRTGGIGPRMALTILSGIGPDEFVSCIHNNDVNTLVRLPGVGRKTAERLLMEMRDKFKEGDQAPRESGVFPERPAGAGAAHDLQEAESALISLGYKPQEAIKAVSQAARQLEEAGTGQDIEALIRLALKNMA